jgi:hypothetical protein
MKYILTIALLFNVAFGQSLFGVVAGDGTFDPDAKRLIDSVVARGGNPTTAQRTALNKLYKKMKGRWSGYSVNYWTDSVLHFYIPIFATATSDSAMSRFNGRNPAANHLTFLSGVNVTFSSSGITSSGVGAAALVNGVTPSTLPTNSYGFGAYANTAGSQYTVYMGVSVTSPSTIQNYIYPDFAGIAYYTTNHQSPATATAVTRTGFHFVTRTASNASAAYRNGSLVVSWNTSSVSGATQPYYLLGRNNNGSLADRADQRFAFFIFTTGLSATGVTNIYNMINEFLTELGIN